MIEMPSHFTLPTMKMHDGNGDPVDHISKYKQRMHTTVVHQYQRESCMCKGFRSSLAGPALHGFVNLPNVLISSFVELHDLFIEQFSSSRKILKKDRTTCTQSNNGSANPFEDTLGDSTGKK